MKIIKLLFVLPIIAIFFMLSGTPFTACTKTTTDTVFRTHDSAVYIHDTTVKTDPVFDLTSGLVAYYTFNGGSLSDSSGYHNDITFNNASPASDRLGRANNAFLFKGDSCYMSVPSSPSLNPDNITLYAIIKIDSFYSGTDQNNMVLVKGWENASGQYFLNFLDWPNNGATVDTSKEYFDGDYGDPGSGIGIGYQSASHISAGNWYKLAYTFDGLTVNLYINGVLVGTKSAPSVQFTDNTTKLYIGANPDDPSGLFKYWFSGVIDEIRIYDRALPGGAIAQLSNLTD